MAIYNIRWKDSATKELKKLNKPDIPKIISAVETLSHTPFPANSKRYLARFSREKRARIPWARFFVTLRYLLGHVEALRWVPYQMRSRDFVHLFIGLGKKQMTGLPNQPDAGDGW